MSGLFDDDDIPSGASARRAVRPNNSELSVSELSGAIKRAIEDGFSYVRVRGEVGRVSRPRSGHVYFDLKDDNAVINAICWKGQAARLAVQPAEGDEVVATGKLTTYPGQSRYQIIVSQLELAGEGALLKKLEETKRRLAAEGLMEESRKRALPYLPRRIGVVTSPSGAVIRDILHRLSDRFPVEVLLWPVAVQGQGCAEQVARAVRGFDGLPAMGDIARPDLVIVARGGGSLEDLWGFNEEIVARAVADCRLPVISAVGHETDHTLVDLVADYRAPTPTAAAERAVPVRADLLADLSNLSARSRKAMRRNMDLRGEMLGHVARALPKPEQLLANAMQRLDGAAERLPMALTNFVTAKRARLAQSDAGRFSPVLLQGVVRQRRRDLDGLDARLAPERLTRLVVEAGRLFDDRLSRLALAARHGQQRRADRLESAARMLDTLSYKATLKRGYAVVRDEQGKLVSAAAQIQHGARMRVEFAQDALSVQALGLADSAASLPQTDKPSKKPARKPKKAKPDDDAQGSLF